MKEMNVKITGMLEKGSLSAKGEKKDRNLEKIRSGKKE